MSPLGSEEIAGLGLEQVVRDAPVAIAVIDAPAKRSTATGARELTSRQIDSAPGRGTTVRLGVPLDERSKPEQTARILLIDDHAPIREALAAMLEREPELEVSAQAASLDEARRLLEGVDVALIDLAIHAACAAAPQTCTPMVRRPV
jgi:PleD family two-component response regulator